MTKWDIPTVAECEAAIGERAAAWAGRCYEIASRIHAAGLVPGRVVYGHWLGPIHARSIFALHGALPFVRHGWIVTDDDSGEVFDPTRWVFEAREPYLFVGEPPDPVIAPCEVCDLLREEHDGGVHGQCGDYQPPPKWPYDEGGNKWRALVLRPCPPRRRGEPQLRLSLPRGVKRRVGLPLRPTPTQVRWLANLPYELLGADVARVYAALRKKGYGAWIPIDNQRRADAEIQETA